MTEINGLHIFNVNLHPGLLEKYWKLFSWGWFETEIVVFRKMLDSQWEMHGCFNWKIKNYLQMVYLDRSIIEFKSSYNKTSPMISKVTLL